MTEKQEAEIVVDRHVVHSFIELRGRVSSDDVLDALSVADIGTIGQIRDRRDAAPENFEADHALSEAWEEMSQAAPPRTIWEILNLGLPPLGIDEAQIDVQGRSTTEFAEYSHTPTGLEVWTGFEQEIREASKKDHNNELVRRFELSKEFLKIQRRGERVGIVRITREEDVTQNAVRVLQLAGSLLDLRLAPDNKNVTANTDVTVSARSTAESLPLLPRSKVQRRIEVMDTSKRNVRCILETKPHWKYDFLESASTQECIIANWKVPDEPGFTEVPKEWSSAEKRIFHLIRQVYGQMREDKLQYGAFHTYERWWFCRIDESGTLHVSNGLKRDATNPSVLQAIRTLRDLAEAQARIEGEIAKHASSPIKKPPSKKRSRDGTTPTIKDRTPKRRGSSGNKSHGTSSDGGQELSASKIELWNCRHLASTQFTKLFSTPCGNGFVKIVIERKMEQQVLELENEAAVYGHMLANKVDPGAIPAFFGCSDHVGVPLLCLGMEGSSFDDIGLSNLTLSLKESAVQALQAISNVGVLHGDLALRNIVQSRADPNKAKIVDFGRAVLTDDEDLLDGQVESVKRMLGLDASSPPYVHDVTTSFQPLPA